MLLPPLDASRWSTRCCTNMQCTSQHIHRPSMMAPFWFWMAMTLPFPFPLVDWEIVSYHPSSAFWPPCRQFCQPVWIWQGCLSFPWRMISLRYHSICSRITKRSWSHTLLAVGQHCWMENLVAKSYEADGVCIGIATGTRNPQVNVTGCSGVWVAKFVSSENPYPCHGLTGFDWS